MRKLRPIIALIILMPFISACNYVVSMSPGRVMAPEENQKVYKVGKPYEVDGKWYHPEHNTNYSETGLASWYGSDFHGDDTANGETFNKYAMTGAHRTLPMPCIVKVTNLENGKSVKVRINDRGPFVSGRIIDVSKEAAEKLGFIDKGTAKVRVQYLPKETASLFPQDSKQARKAETFTSAPSGNIMQKSLMPQEAVGVHDPKIQQSLGRSSNVNRIKEVKKNAAAKQKIYVAVGSYANKNEAASIIKEIVNIGSATYSKNNGSYKVVMGPYENSKNADKIVNKLNQAGYKNAFIISR